MTNINDNNGIVKSYVNGIEYNFWTHADYMKPCIIKFLKDRFLGKVVVRELNMIDLSIPEENLPIEIQATVVTTLGYPTFARFEKDVRDQIDQGVIYGISWLFFDSELLRSMKNAGRGMSINMDWFRKLMKEEKLKVFTVSYDGIIEEKQYGDFDFLAYVSQTCPVAAGTDDAILNKNKMKIYTNVRKLYNFTQDDIDKFYDAWRKYCDINNIDRTDRNDKFYEFLRKQKDERSKLYGNVLHDISNLPTINDLLISKTAKDSTKWIATAKHYASILGIFDVYGGSSHNATTIFVDRANICQYFPGYVRNKEMWDYLKESKMELNRRQFDAIVEGRINPLDWKITIEEKLNYKRSTDIQSEQSDDKYVEIKQPEVIYVSEYSTVKTVYSDIDGNKTTKIEKKKSVKKLSDTKQKTIEEAWCV